MGPVSPVGPIGPPEGPVAPVAPVGPEETVKETHWLAPLIPPESKPELLETGTVPVIVILSPLAEVPRPGKAWIVTVPVLEIARHGPLGLVIIEVTNALAVFVEFKVQEAVPAVTPL